MPSSDLPAEPFAGAALRRLLNRRDLAAARYRSLMSRRLGLGESEMLAVAQLAQHGELSPSELAQLLGLSSGGVTALVQRLEGAGHLVRRADPADGRRTRVSLSPALVERAARAFGPLTTELDRAGALLTEQERRIVGRYLAAVVNLTEEHADRARDVLEARPGEAPAAPVPALWG